MARYLLDRGGEVKAAFVAEGKEKHVPLLEQLLEPFRPLAAL
ncbi:MAG: hypothetical protein ACK4G4_08995 [Thermus sp.]